MSWYGHHPMISKRQAKKAAPKACKLSIYWLRCFPSFDHAKWFNLDEPCHRCGCTKRDMLTELAKDIVFVTVEYKLPMPVEFIEVKFTVPTKEEDLCN